MVGLIKLACRGLCSCQVLHSTNHEHKIDIETLLSGTNPGCTKTSQMRSRVTISSTILMLCTTDNVPMFFLLFQLLRNISPSPKVDGDLKQSLSLSGIIAESDLQQLDGNSMQPNSLPFSQNANSVSTPLSWGSGAE